MQYVAFDYLAWVACACFFVLLCKSRDPRWWLAVGACIGFGMVTVHRDIFICRHLHESWPEFWKNFRRYG